MNDGKPPRRGASPNQDPYPTALRMLGRRDYSSTDLRRKLMQRGFASDKIDAALGRCRELGYLDDQRFAEQTARNLVNSGRAVGRRLQLELKKRGIDSTMAEQASTTAIANVDRGALISELAARRYPGFNYTQADDGQRRRVVNFFLRRGFSLGDILSVLKNSEES